eukprot:350932-Prorocentrum_minimum.AAC.2
MPRARARFSSRSLPNAHAPSPQPRTRAPLVSTVAGPVSRIMFLRVELRGYCGNQSRGPREHIPGAGTNRGRPREHIPGAGTNRGRPRD